MESQQMPPPLSESPTRRPLTCYADVLDAAATVMQRLPAKRKPTPLPSRGKDQTTKRTVSSKQPPPKKTRSNNEPSPGARPHPPHQKNNENRKKPQKEKILHLTAPQEKRIICKYWMEGTCVKGPTCPFSHSLPPNRTPEQARHENAQTPCKYFMMGTCARGVECLYSHDLSGVPCRFLHGVGQCSRGSACPYSHAEVSDEVKAEIILQMRHHSKSGGANGENDMNSVAVENNNNSSSSSKSAPAPTIGFVDYTSFSVPRLPSINSLR